MSLTGSAILNFAHRGYTRTAPENTLAAFHAALDLGVDGIEFDVRTCKSGEVLVFHDHKIDRLTEGRGLVKNMSFAELREFHVSGATVPAGGHLIPTFKEVLELVSGRLFLNVEIKANGLPAKHYIERKVVDLLKRFGMLEKTIISSFNPLIVRRAGKVDSRVTTGFLVDKTFNVRNSELLFSKITGAGAIHLEHTMVTTSLSRKIHGRNLRLLVWTVNQPEEMLKLAKFGVDGIISDRPDLLKQVLAEWRS